MSNDLGSQLLSIPNSKTEKMDSMSSNLGLQQLPISNKQKGLMEPMSIIPGSQQVSIPNKQIQLIEQMSNTPGLQQLSLPNKQVVRIDPMSNNPESQQLLMPRKQIGQMEPTSISRGSPYLSLQSNLMGQIEPLSNNLGSQQLLLPNDQMRHMELLSNNLGPQQLLPSKQLGQVEPMVYNLGNNLASKELANKRMGQMEPMPSNPGSQQFLMPNKLVAQGGTIFNSASSQQLSISTKRKALMEPTKNYGSQYVFIPNQHVAQMELMSNNPGLQQGMTPNKRTVQGAIQSRFNSDNLGLQQSSGPNKRTVQMENKLGSRQLSMSNKRTVQMEPSPKGQNESFESVRSKMRESLAAAFALVSQQENKLSNDGNNIQGEAPSTPRQAHEDAKPVESTSTTVDVASDHVPENPLDNSFSKVHDSQMHSGGQNAAEEKFVSENKEEFSQTSKCDGQESQLKDVSAEEDVSFSNFLIKDELLQGNGLCWATDFDIEIVETNEIQSAKRPKVDSEQVSGEGGEPAGAALSPSQTLAVQIEAELFKFFGGVNKKYKEKGRSLLFNLKDRNNPELRERVMSGEITPERLCSMTAEELASKELSEWRIAKAEELAQMVVLPDSEVDIRRLVKKTHKGEFQVEFEQDDSVSVEVAVGANSLIDIRSRNSEAESQLPSKPNETKGEVVEKIDSDDQSLHHNVTSLPQDGTDLMQGLMVDEMKDDDLPPIVSLDEFMESLESEPPFEDLPVDAGEVISISDEKKSSDVSFKLDSLDLGSVDPEGTAPDKPEKMESKSTKMNGDLKSFDINRESETTPPNGVPKGEHVWEGLLQLSTSNMVTIIGIFRSGEKASTREWPSFLEIKGRVRLDAFEKFLQELRMSRSRSIMVAQFYCKEGSSDSERASLSEVVDSYVADERVGFAEASPGVELYLCPTHTRTVEMIGKHLPKDHSETLDDTDQGLIGVVVWRKPHVSSTISPNLSSQHKHSSKKQHHTRKQQEKDTNATAKVNVSAAPRPSQLMESPPTNPKPLPGNEPIEEDDVPPGFGPSAPREEDDLPEFDFAGGSNPSVPKFSTQNLSQGQGMGIAPFNPPARPPRPVEQMRELIQRYGQGQGGVNTVKWQYNRGIGVEVEPWNDDDDIPEWQPQPLVPQQQLPPPPPLPIHSFQPQLPVPQHLVNQHHLQHQQQPHHSSQPLMAPLQPHQPQINLMMQGQQSVAPSWQQGTWWAPPPSSGSHGQPVQGNGLSQQCNFGGQLHEGQLYGTPGYGTGPNGPNWRQDVPRSRGL